MREKRDSIQFTVYSEQCIDFHAKLPGRDNSAGPLISKVQFIIHRVLRERRKAASIG